MASLRFKTIVGILLLLIMLGACARKVPEKPVDMSGLTPCGPRTRATSCPDFSQPTCGFHADRSNQTFPSPCVACIDASIIGYADGECQAS
jgi:hypothetical protein